jgi:hypothetical protein
MLDFLPATKVKLNKQLKEVIDKVLEKVEGVV